LIHLKAALRGVGQADPKRGITMRQILMVLAVLSFGGAAAAAPRADAGGESATRGLYVALRVCAACHAVATLGAGPDGLAPPFAAIRLRHDKAGLRRRLGEISTSGHQEMPPIPLTAREIEDVATYIETVVPTPAAATPSPPLTAAQPPRIAGRHDRRLVHSG